MTHFCASSALPPRELTEALAVQYGPVPYGPLVTLPAVGSQASVAWVAGSVLLAPKLLSTRVPGASPGVSVVWKVILIVEPGKKSNPGNDHCRDAIRLGSVGSRRAVNTGKGSGDVPAGHGRVDRERQVAGADEALVEHQPGGDRFGDGQVGHRAGATIADVERERDRLAGSATGVSVLWRPTAACCP